MSPNDPSKERSYVLQLDIRESFFRNPIKDGWIVVRDSWRDDHSSGAIFPALVPTTELATSLRDGAWDLKIGHAAPGCSVSSREGKEVITYHRFSEFRTGIEPLVIHRTFHNIRPDSEELLEEFRLFHNLYEDQRSGTFIRIDDAGNEHIVVRCIDKRIEIRAKEIRQFLALKRMNLVLQIDSVRHSPFTPAEVTPDPDLEFSDSQSVYSLNVRPGMPLREEKSFSRLLGKRAIAPLPLEKSGFWPYSERDPEDYPEFIVGTDDDGDPIKYTCDPDELGNYFGANPGAPHYLTPVYFRREVLNRYYADPGKYSVEDGAIRCGGLWILGVDNHLDDVVGVFLGDLGKDLPASERSHWLSYNIASDAGISDVILSRAFEANPADPRSEDLLFKYRLGQFIEAWDKKINWPLFLPLPREDQHLLIALRVPISDDHAEFDSQVLALTKILVDSLNEEALKREVTELPEDAGGITKLSFFLQGKGFPDEDRLIGYLRKLQGLRSSGVAHRKGANFAKAASATGLAKIGPRAVLREFLRRARSEVLEPLGDFFLDAGWR